MIKAVFIIFNLLGILAYQFNSDLVSVTQIIPDKISPGQSFIVELQINKGSHNGFAKWQQELPDGFQAEMMETKGGTFSFKDNTLKLIWLELPNDESFSISYRVYTEVGLRKKWYNLNGRFSYVSENERKDVESSVETIYISKPSTAAPLHREREQDNTHGRTERTMDFSSQKNKKSKALVSAPKLGSSASIRSYNPSTNNAVQISYRVQIAAGHNSVQTQYNKYFQIDDPIAIENHDGWKKYTIGDFSDYRHAQEKRNSLWVSNKKIEGAFVTAYLSGQRISVDEALKISEQQWIK